MPAVVKVLAKKRAEKAAQKALKEAERAAAKVKHKAAKAEEAEKALIALKSRKAAATTLATGKSKSSTDLTWPELEKRMPKQIVREKDEDPPADPSDSEDEEEMASYPKFFKQLQDTLVV